MESNGLAADMWDERKHIAKQLFYMSYFHSRIRGAAAPAGSYKRLFMQRYAT